MKKDKKNKKLKKKNSSNVELSKELGLDRQCNDNKNAANKKNCKGAGSNN